MKRILSLVVALTVLGQENAYAYIDPNAGGLLYQLLFPLLIAIAGVWAAFRQKIAHLLSLLAQKFRRR